MFSAMQGFVVGALNKAVSPVRPFLESDSALFRPDGRRGFPLAPAIN